MTLQEKLNFIQCRNALNDRKFCHKYRIKPQVLWQIRHNLYEPQPNDFRLLCEDYNLDVMDFIDPTSTIRNSKVQPGEHVCKLAKINENSDNYEDFPKESNDRYEEKD